jgi:hypothetical protein
MTKLIRIAIGCLALCGTLAVLPGVAEAREQGRPAAAHVDRDRGHDRDRGDRDRGRFGRDHGRFERGRDCRWDRYGRCW